MKSGGSTENIFSVLQYWTFSCSVSSDALIRLTRFHFRKAFSHPGSEAAVAQQQLPICMLKMPSIMHRITSPSWRNSRIGISFGWWSITPKAGSATCTATSLALRCGSLSFGSITEMWQHFGFYFFVKSALSGADLIFFSCCSQRVTRQEWWTVCWRPCSREQLSETAGNGRRECKVREFLQTLGYELSRLKLFGKDLPAHFGFTGNHWGAIGHCESPAQSVWPVKAPVKAQHCLCAHGFLTCDSVCPKGSCCVWNGI